MISDVESMCIQSLEMVLESDGMPIRNSCDIKIKRDAEGTLGLWVIFRIPSPIVPNENNYALIFSCLYYTLYPKYTVCRPTQLTIRTYEDSTDFSMNRAFWYLLKEGQPKRLTGTVNQLIAGYDLLTNLPLTENIKINFRENTNVFVAGDVGSGKTYAMLTLAKMITRIPHATVWVIDPKRSSLSRYCRHHANIRLIVPENNERPEDFLLRVNSVLNEILQSINEIQTRLFNESPIDDCDFHILSDCFDKFLFFEELEAATAGVKRSIVQEFQALLTKVAITARESGWHLILSSQVASVSGTAGTGATLTSSSRAQMQVRIQLGRLTNSSVVQLFPELRSGGIPTPYGGKGSGIISIADQRNYGVVQPILLPTIKEGTKDDRNRN